MAVENFTAADGTALTSLSNWATVFISSGSVPTVLSNALANTTTVADYAARRTDGPFPDDQFAEFKITADAAGVGGLLGCVVRASAVASTYYMLTIWPSHSSAGLSKVVAGVETSLATGSLTAVLNDVIRLTVTGTNLVSTVNGSTINMPTSTSDASIASGSPGIRMYGIGVAGSSMDIFTYTNPAAIAFPVGQACL